MTSVAFREKLEQAWSRTGSMLCVGLDPDPARTGGDVGGYLAAIVDATSDLVCAFKPNVAFFEALGPERGYAELRRVLDAIPPEVVTIADAKRGDVPHTARAYATAIFDSLGFDAATVNPYLGADATEPFLERADRGAFILCRTSNPGARALQDLEVASPDGPRPLYETVALSARSWDRHANVGLVVGATWPGELRRIRELCPDAPILVPGIGAQEGSVGETVRAGLSPQGTGLVVSASRSILYAGAGPDAPAAARTEALRLRDLIARERDALLAGA